MSANDVKLSPEEQEKARRERIEAAKKKMKDQREGFKKDAVRITEELLQGTDIREDVVVKLINGKYGIITIRPLSEGEIMDIFSKVGMDRLSNLEKQAQLGDYELYWLLVSKSSGLSVDAIKKNFMMGESTIVGDRILEISGLGAESPDRVESFP